MKKMKIIKKQYKNLLVFLLLLSTILKQEKNKIIFFSNYKYNLINLEKI